MWVLETYPVKRGTARPISPSNHLPSPFVNIFLMYTHFKAEKVDEYESDIEALWTALNVSHVPCLKTTPKPQNKVTWNRVSSVTPAHPLFSV